MRSILLISLENDYNLRLPDLPALWNQLPSCWYVGSLILCGPPNHPQAHSHARKASIETHKANPVVASEEHDLAAGEFANAAKTTGDVEVLSVSRCQYGADAGYRHCEL